MTSFGLKNLTCLMGNERTKLFKPFLNTQYVVNIALKGGSGVGKTSMTTCLNTIDSSTASATKPIPKVAPTYGMSTVPIFYYDMYTKHRPLVEFRVHEISGNAQFIHRYDHELKKLGMDAAIIMCDGTPYSTRIQNQESVKMTHLMERSIPICHVRNKKDSLARHHTPGTSEHWYNINGLHVDMSCKMRINVELPLICIWESLKSGAWETNLFDKSN
jgi:hypothetical protein